MRRLGPRSWITLLTSVAILSAGIAGAVTRDTRGEPLRLRYVFVAGRTSTYDLSMDLRGRLRGLQPSEPIEGSVSARVVSRVSSVARDGSARIELTVSDVRSRLTGAGTGAPVLPPSARLLLHVEPDGTVRGVEGSSGLIPTTPGDPLASLGVSGGATDPLAALLFLKLPARPIAPGDRWTDRSTVPFPVGEGRIRTRIDGEHEGYEDDAEGRVAELRHGIRLDLETSAPFSSIFETFARQLAGQVGGRPPAVQPPAELRDVRFELRGALRGDSLNRIETATGEIDSVEGRTTAEFTVEFAGIPTTGEPFPSRIGFTFDVGLDLRRTR